VVTMKAQYRVKEKLEIIYDLSTWWVILLSLSIGYPDFSYSFCIWL